MPQDVPAALRKPQIAGILLVAPLPPLVIAMASQRKPCVGLGVHGEGVRMDCIGQDDRSAVGEVVKRLKELGHRKIGYYCKGLRPSFARARFAGYVEALAHEGLPYDPGYSVNVWEKSDGIGMASVAQVTASGVRAWICAHDDWGYELVRYLQGQGYSVPEDVSVCGFDHLHVPTGAQSLLSVEWPFEDLGAAAIEMLVRRINEPMRSVGQLLFDGRLLDGESAAALRLK